MFVRFERYLQSVSPNYHSVAENLPLDLIMRTSNEENGHGSTATTTTTTGNNKNGQETGGMPYFLDVDPHYDPEVHSPPSEFNLEMSPRAAMNFADF